MALKQQKNTSLMYECFHRNSLYGKIPTNQETTNQNACMQLPQEFLSIIFKIKNNNNKWRWLAVNLYQAMKQRGK